MSCDSQATHSTEDNQRLCGEHASAAKREGALVRLNPEALGYCQWDPPAEPGTEAPIEEEPDAED